MQINGCVCDFAIFPLDLDTISEDLAADYSEEKTQYGDGNKNQERRLWSQMKARYALDVIISDSGSVWLEHGTSHCKTTDESNSSASCSLVLDSSTVLLERDCRQQLYNSCLMFRDLPIHTGSFKLGLGLAL